jgi:hypothetical protein
MQAVSHNRFARATRQPITSSLTAAIVSIKQSERRPF